MRKIVHPRDTVATMNINDANKQYSNLKNEIIKFLNNRAEAFPAQAEAILTIRDEISSVSIPDQLPQPLRLPGCRHLPAALEMAEAGPMPIESAVVYNATEFGRTVFRAARSQQGYGEALKAWLKTTQGRAWLELSEDARNNA